MSESMLQDQLEHSRTVTLMHSAQLYGKADPGLPLLRINNGKCDATIAIQGAQLLQFRAHGGSELLWLSPNALFVPGKAIRGGIPVCLPWFGVNRVDPTKPSHGFVRNRDWILESIDEPDADRTELCFLYLSDEQDLTLFPEPFSTRLRITLSDQIDMDLEVSNHGDDNIPVSWALHSYHPVSSLEDTRISGLDGIYYLDNTNGLEPTLQEGDISFSGELDRVYETVPPTQEIDGQPQILISGEHCETAIVWNPGAEVAARMEDVGAGGHEQFICLERGAAFANGWTIAPEDQLSARVTISEIK